MTAILSVRFFLFGPVVTDRPRDTHAPQFPHEIRAGAAGENDAWVQGRQPAEQLSRQAAHAGLIRMVDNRADGFRRNRRRTKFAPGTDSSESSGIRGTADIARQPPAPKLGYSAGLPATRSWRRKRHQAHGRRNELSYPWYGHTRIKAYSSCANVRDMRLEALGVIGNCQFSALIHNSGEIVWCCLPRFDSEPVFSTLLDSQDGGRFRIGPANGETGTQRYLPNTNILETTFQTSTGSFRVIDFAPRFLQFGRAFRPTQLIRIVEPIEGTPRIAVVCEPRLGWSKARPTRRRARTTCASRDSPASCGSPPTFRSPTSAASRSRSPGGTTWC